MKKFITLGFMTVALVSISGCESLSEAINDPKFMDSLTQLAESVDKYNEARRASVSNRVNAQPAAQEKPYLERPCQQLTTETTSFSNILRARYPAYNTNTRDMCMLNKEFLVHLRGQYAKAGSCDASGAYRKGLENRISQYVNLIQQLGC